MKIAVLVVRILLGLIFLILGLNGFFQFLPAPPLEGKAASFLGAMLETGYLFQIVKGVEVLAAIALLSGVYLPLMLVILMPITLNIFWFHLFLTPDSVVMSVVILLMQIFLAWVYRSYYTKLLSIKASF